MKHFEIILVRFETNMKMYVYLLIKVTEHVGRIFFLMYYMCYIKHTQISLIMYQV